MAISPVPAFPALSDRATGTYNSKAFAWASHMADTFAPEVNALTANLNSIAAGGAYAIPYTFGVDYNSSTGLTVGTAQGGILAVESTKPNQGATAYIYADIKSAGGRSSGPSLDQFDDSTSSIRGQIRIEKAGDPSKWMLFNVTGLNSSGPFHRAIPVALVDSSSASPFGAGEPVLLYFQRTGDKGDKGDAAPIQNFPTLYVRDEKPSNTGGGGTLGTVMTRVLNAVKLNTIAGASLSSSQVTLPAGTYEFIGSVPAYGVNSFRAQLWNSTDGVSIEVGTSEYCDAASGRTSARSFVRGSFTIASSKSIALRMIAMNGGAGNLGAAANDGNVEVYSELWIKKVA